MHNEGLHDLYVPPKYYIIWMNKIRNEVEEVCGTYRKEAKCVLGGENKKEIDHLEDQGIGGG
jgi:hypothetical protein